MKKRNIFWGMLTIIMVTVLSVGFVSCSSDDDDKDSYGLSGTSWIYQESSDESITLNFKSNGTGTIVEKYYDSYYGMDTDTYSFTYTMTGKAEGRMVIKYYDSYSGYDNEEFYFKIEGKTLYLYNDYGDSLVFSRK